MKRRTLKKLRKLYLISSILFGIVSPIICISFFPEFDPRIHPVSYFGILKNTSWIFLISLIIFSIAIFWNGITIIRKLIKNKNHQFILKLLLSIASICLFITGIIPMNYGPFHHIPALFFFLIYNFFLVYIPQTLLFSYYCIF